MAVSAVWRLANLLEGTPLSTLDEFRRFPLTMRLSQYFLRVLPSLEVKIMDKSLIFIEKQVYKTVTHFGGQIPKGFEVFLRGHPCHINGQFECDQPQLCSTNFHPAS